jgi:hypothetical protein
MKKRTHDQWQELFALHDTSGVSAAEFCKQNNLCPKYFSLRRKQLAKLARKENTGFIRVKMKPDTKCEASGAMTSSLVIHSPAGKLVFSILPAPHWLAHLLRELA